MKFCNKCGKSIDESISFCGNCGEPLDNLNKEQLGFDLISSTEPEETEEFFGVITDRNNEHSTLPSNNTNNTDNSSLETAHSTLPLTQKKDKGEKSRKVIPTILCVLAIILLLSGILLHKPILSKVFLIKGDKAYIETVKIEYYCKSINYKYNKESVDKISEVLNQLDNGETILKSYENLLSKKDFNNLMCNIYINKAVKAFQNEQFQETMEFVKTSEKYGYNKADFLYYNETKTKLEEIEATKNAELEKKKIEEEAKKEEEKKKEASNKAPSTETIYKFISSGDGFIIPDSSSVRLTKSDLIGMDRDTLYLARNEMWARHGFIFKQEPFKSYFPRQSWYIPNPNAGGGTEHLTTIEQYNVRLIDDVLKNGM